MPPPRFPRYAEGTRSDRAAPSPRRRPARRLSARPDWRARPRTGLPPSRAGTEAWAPRPRAAPWPPSFRPARAPATATPHRPARPARAP
ncbi:hypothetical protein B5V46_01495 [Rhodovulum sp. MB263]|nr:hypothetical protein B5V46_01495 [Rhodovulum sp. MB263]